MGRLPQKESHKKEYESLPPRATVHKRKKRWKVTITYPLIRLLVILFFIVVLLMFTSPYWLSF